MLAILSRTTPWAISVYSQAYQVVQFGKKCLAVSYFFQLDIITVDFPGSIPFIQFSTGNKTKTELAFLLCFVSTWCNSNVFSTK